ncbi:MAG: CvpA family protein [Thermoanaerobacteraceae bacterium]|nr:CvpA family protein [Thermoanaerobacteraceae bacterium]
MLIILIIAWSAWRGLETGLVAGLARLTGLFLGLAAAMRYHTALAGYLSGQWPLEQWIRERLTAPTGGMPAGFNLPAWEKLIARGVLEILAFILILLLVSQLVCLAGQMAARAARFSFLGPVDRAGGVLLGAVRGLVLVVILLVLLAALTTPGGGGAGVLPPWLDRAVAGSSLARPLIEVATGALQLTLPADFPATGVFRNITGPGKTI